MKNWKAGVATGMLTGAAVTGVWFYSKLKKAQELGIKNGYLVRTLSEWLRMKQEGKDFIKFFIENEYKTIAIYGMSFLGQCLLKELEKSDITVLYAIDKNANALSLNSNIKILNIDDNLEDVDVIIVTPVFYYDEIEEELLKKIDCPIISLEDIIYDF